MSEADEAGEGLQLRARRARAGRIYLRWLRTRSEAWSGREALGWSKGEAQRPPPEMPGRLQESLTN